MFLGAAENSPCSSEALATTVSMLCYATSSYQGSKQYIESHSKKRIEEFFADPFVINRIGLNIILLFVFTLTIFCFNLSF